MKENGIEVQQSIPHAHQQNSRTERLIRMLREKAETMRLKACLPQSWWEFTLDHATHVYNKTPVRRLNWQTPHQTLKGDKPYVNHLRVFGCGAYVFIPAEVQGNKLVPRSELMTYLGTHPGGKGWIFMHSPNNVIFSAAQATFDEAFFPKCLTSKGVRQNTRLHTPAPKPKPCPCKGNKDCQCLHSGNEDDDDNDEPPRRPSSSAPAPPKNNKGKERALEDHDSPKALTQMLPPRSPSPDAPQEPAKTTETGRPKRHAKVPKQPGNVYGDKHPTQIEKEIRKKRDWSKIVGEKPWSRGNKEPEPVPGPSSPPPERSPSPEGASSGSEDNNEVEKSLEPSSDDNDEDATLARLCQEGGVKFQAFLISKAVSPTPMEKSPREWKY